MPDELLQRLRRFRSDYFPGHQQRFQDLVAQGQHPGTLFIGCSDSRLVPYLLTGAGPGELFIVRNVGAIVPPWDGWIGREGDRASSTAPVLRGARQWVGYHGTAAAIEFAVLLLKVRHIVVCGHSHCGAMRALYDEPPSEAPHLAAWLDLAREAALPVVPTPEALARTEQRSIVVQLERLMDYPMVRTGVQAGQLALHGWHYMIEDGEVWVFDVGRGGFVPASQAEHSGTGPYRDMTLTPPQGALFNEIDDALAPASLRAPPHTGRP